MLAQWRATAFLKDQDAAARGWLTQVMKCVEAIGREAFGLDEVYAFEDRLARVYPGNNNIRPKIRQQLPRSGPSCGRPRRASSRARRSSWTWQ